MRVDLSDRRRVVGFAAVGALILLLVALLVGHVAQGSSGGSSLDPQLKQVADSTIPQLEHPSGKLPIKDASLTSFQAWVYDAQPTLARIVGGMPARQWAQLVMSDPNTLPPQSPVVNVPQHPALPVDPGVVTQALHSGQGQYVTVQISNGTLRVYVVPFKAPSVLAQAGCTGVLEVIGIQSVTS